MAVELGGRLGRDLPGPRFAVGRFEQVLVLVEAEGAGERLLSRDARSQTWQAVEQHVDLELAALRRGRRRSALQLREHRRRHARENEAGSGHAAVEPHLARSRTVLDSRDRRIRAQLRPGFVGSALQRSRDRPHPAHRHPPGAADHVVEEAAVLDERRFVERGEGADQAVGGHHAADQAVLEAIAQHLPERPLG
jgi:hypothetical protein